MFKDYISFEDTIECVVEVFTVNGKRVGEGELRVSKDSVPVVHFGIFSKLQPFFDNTYFLCKSRDQVFTLLGCRVEGLSIVPAILVKGEKKNGRFTNVSILLECVSEWMDNSGESTITKTSISKERETRKFSVDVLDGDQQLRISNEHWCSIGKKDGNNFLIQQYTLISCEAVTGKFSASDVMNKAHEIRNIFSLLIGRSLSIKYVFDETNSKTKSVYFPHLSEPQPSFNIHRSICSSEYLHKHNLWDDIFKGFYEKKPKVFKEVWSRLAGALSYSGFWEYKILTYVSLLDRYVSLCSENQGLKLSRDKFRSLRHSLKETLIDIGADGESQSIVMESLSGQIERLKNSSFSSFQERFDFTVNLIDDEVKTIVALKPKHFRDLKKIRDEIAHGGEPTTLGGQDIAYELILTNKTRVLLFYWAYRDFGFSDRDFINMLHRSYSPVLLEAYLDRVMIDKAVGIYRYFDLMSSDFKSIETRSDRTIVLEYFEGGFTFHSEYTDMLERFYQSDLKVRFMLDYMESFVDESRIKNIVNIGVAYIRQGEEVCKITSCVYVLNASPEIMGEVSHTQVKIYDDEVKSWNNIELLWSLDR